MIFILGLYEYSALKASETPNINIYSNRSRSSSDSSTASNTSGDSSSGSQDMNFNRIPSTDIPHFFNNLNHFLIDSCLNESKLVNILRAVRLEHIETIHQTGNVPLPPEILNDIFYDILVSAENEESPVPSITFPRYTFSSLNFQNKNHSDNGNSIEESTPPTIQEIYKNLSSINTPFNFNLKIILLDNVLRGFFGCRLKPDQINEIMSKFPYYPPSSTSMVDESMHENSEKIPEKLKELNNLIDEDLIRFGIYNVPLYKIQTKVLEKFDLIVSSMLQQIFQLKVNSFGGFLKLPDVQNPQGLPWLHPMPLRHGVEDLYAFLAYANVQEKSREKYIQTKIDVVKDLHLLMKDLKPQEVLEKLEDICFGESQGKQDLFPEFFIRDLAQSVQKEFSNLSAEEKNLLLKATKSLSSSKISLFTLKNNLKNFWDLLINEEDSPYPFNYSEDFSTKTIEKIRLIKTALYSHTGRAEYIPPVFQYLLVDGQHLLNQRLQAISDDDLNNLLLEGETIINEDITHILTLCDMLYQIDSTLVQDHFNRFKNIISGYFSDLNQINPERVEILKAGEFFPFLRGVLLDVFQPSLGASEFFNFVLQISNSRHAQHYIDFIGSCLNNFTTEQRFQILDLLNKKAKEKANPAMIAAFKQHRISGNYLKDPDPKKNGGIYGLFQNMLSTLQNDYAILIFSVNELIDFSGWDLFTTDEKNKMIAELKRIKGTPVAHLKSIKKALKNLIDQIKK